ncbi:YciI family protein [Maribacter sp.]
MVHLKQFGICIFLMAMACKETPSAQHEVTETSIVATEEPKKTALQLKEELMSKGFEIFDYVDEETKDTVLMQQYYIAFLKRGPNRSQNKAEADSLQALHMAHLGRMYEEGYADISGPFGDDGDIRGITIYNTPTLKIADSLANLDPMVKSGRLRIEVHPWWAAKGFPLR